MVSDLVLRYLWLHGAGTLALLHDTLKLSFPVLETVFHEFRQQQLLEVKGMVGNDYSFSLTPAGRHLATARSEVCQYVGPAPVSIQQYHEVVKGQNAKLRLSRDSLRRAFHDLVLPDGLLDQLGPSLIGHQSLFLYGGTGSGKTSIAERILRIYQDTVIVPYAVEVDGHIIAVFDPIVHKPIEAEDEFLDPRWVICHRPCITMGGELSAAMLELRLDEATHVFIAPCQMKANNGILVVDDFGRQVVSPQQLLNRWIVPLDRRVDYLTLASGMKFQVPFELMVVFSTNLDPEDLADEAFLRRIQTKVLVEDVNERDFRPDRQAGHHRPQRACRDGLRRVHEGALHRRRRNGVARLLPDGHSQTGEGNRRVRGTRGPPHPRQHRSGRRACTSPRLRPARRAREAEARRLSSRHDGTPIDTGKASGFLSVFLGVVPWPWLFPVLTGPALPRGALPLCRGQSVGLLRVAACVAALDLRAGAGRTPDWPPPSPLAASLTWMRLFTASAPAPWPCGWRCPCVAPRLFCLRWWPRRLARGPENGPARSSATWRTWRGCRPPVVRRSHAAGWLQARFWLERWFRWREGARSVRRRLRQASRVPPGCERGNINEE